MKASLYVAVLLIIAVGASTANAQSSRPGWGATPYSGPGGTGVTFRTWAPNASSANVAGSFNGWSTLTLPLQFESAGVWSRDVPGALPGQPYKFIINGSTWRRDPYSRQIESSGTRNSVIVDPSSFNWGTNSFVMPPANELVIYEMHVGAFYDPVPNDGQVGQYTNVVQKLDHLVNLGINAIELMPISEFPTSTSWGYNLSYPFAIESSYGTPDQLKSLIKACHDRGIAVLMDVVHNHWGDDSDDWSLWQYDGWSTNGYGGVYFYSQPNLCCTWWGPRPDYSRPQVRDYILNNFRMYKKDYRIDGFRWDAPKFMLYTDDTLAIPVPDGSNVINYVINTISNEFPGTFNIAEDIKGVVGFDSHWDMSYQGTIQGIMSLGDDNSRNMNTLAGAINSDPKRIVYTESHDTTGDLNAWAVRFPKAVDGGDAESYYARKRSTLASLITLTSPGTPMIWQGQEMLETNLFSDARSLNWSRTNTFSYITELYRDVIHLRRNLTGVSAGLSGSGCGVFLLSNSDKMIGYRRYDPERPDQDVVVIANLRNLNRANYPVQFPAAGTWYVHVNTDSMEYGPDYEGIGNQQVVASGNPPMAQVNVGRYSALIMSQVPVSGISVHDYDVVDAPYGNGDGIIDPGETIFVSVSVSNRGQMAVSGVAAQLVVSNSGITVSQPLTTFPEILAGSIASANSPLVFQVSSNWVCGQAIDVQFVVNYPGNSAVNFFALPTGLAVDTETFTNTYTSVDVPKAIIDNQSSFSSLVITNLSLGAIESVKVLVRANHSWNSDVVMALQHPDGTEVLLSNRRGGSQDNFGAGTCGVDAEYTVFDMTAVVTISNGVSPFAGTFRPDGDLGLLHGKLPVGTWRLRTSDLVGGDEGSVLCWNLIIAAAQDSYGCETYAAENPDVDNDGLPNWWEVAYYGGSTNAATEVDDDVDGYSNWQEFLAGTDPVNPESYLKVFTTPVENDGGVVIQWGSAQNQTYRLWRTPSLDVEPFTVLQSNIPATPVLNSYFDHSATGGLWFYQVELE
jgi:1,4-alpha-glucan branching enzyme